MPPLQREAMYAYLDQQLLALEEAAAAASQPRAVPQTLPGLEHVPSPAPDPGPDDSDWDLSPF